MSDTEKLGMDFEDLVNDERGVPVLNQTQREALKTLKENPVAGFEAKSKMSNTEEFGMDFEDLVNDERGVPVQNQTQREALKTIKENHTDEDQLEDKLKPKKQHLKGRKKSPPFPRKLDTKYVKVHKENMVNRQKVVGIMIIILINTVKSKTLIKDVEKKTAEENKLTKVKEIAAVKTSREEIAQECKVTESSEFNKFQTVDKHRINYK